MMILLLFNYSIMKLDNKRPYNTVNTFSRRPCINQIISYTIVALDNITFWIFIQPNYESQRSRFTMIALFVCSQVVMLIFGCLTSTYDPSDPIMTKYRNGNSKILEGKNQKCLYCDHCQSFVFRTSRHCKLCDRCVDKFDHHCIWINNCIGKYNYKVFIGMILTAEVHLLIFLISTVLLWTEDKWQSFIASMIVNWTVFAIIFIFSLLLMGLIVLHFYLIFHNITTYEYVIAKKTVQIIPNSPPKANSNTNFHTSSNQLNFKDKSSIDNNSEQARRTGKFNPPISVFENFQKEDDKVSAFRQMSLSRQSRIDHSQIKEDRFSGPFEDSANPDNLSKENLDQFYKTHYGLKLLLGNGVTVTSKLTSSCQQIRDNQIKENRLSISSEEKDMEQLNKIKANFGKINVVFEQ